MNLYEVLVILNPTKKERKNGAKPTILIPLQMVFGDSEQSVSYDTIVNNAETLKTYDGDQVEIRIRPF